MKILLAAGDLLSFSVFLYSKRGTKPKHGKLTKIQSTNPRPETKTVPHIPHVYLKTILVITEAHILQPLGPKNLDIESQSLIRIMAAAIDK